MANIMLKQFTAEHKRSLFNNYVRIFGTKSPKFLNTIVPNLHEDLRKSTELFIEAVFNQDKKFIEATTAKFLRSDLFKDFENMKWERISVKRVPYVSLQSNATKKQEAKTVKFEISPYVIMGLPIQKRVQRIKNPWEDIHYFLSPSRYLHLDSTEQFQQILQDINTHHIYGFNCYYTNPNFSYQTTVQGVTTNHAPREMMVAFETDSENHQFHVTDFNYVFDYS